MPPTPHAHPSCPLETLIPRTPPCPLTTPNPHSCISLQGVEPSEPANIGVLLYNAGFGAATGVSITTQQPEIIDNEKGLLVAFSIDSVTLDDNATLPASLGVQLGTVAPGVTALIVWAMTSSLQGSLQPRNVSVTTRCVWVLG